MQMLSSPISLCTAKLEMYFNDTPLATGTSFFYEYDGRTFVVTNRHNITGRDQYTGKPLDEKNGGIPNNVRLQVPIAEIKGNTAEFGKKIMTLRFKWECDERGDWLEHPTLGSAADVVAFDTSQLKDMPKPFAHANSIPNPIPIAVTPSTKVSVVGYPFGQSVGVHFPVWVSGSLASDIQFDADNKPAMFIDCRTNKGSSGSPVFSFFPGGNVPLEHTNFGEEAGMIAHYKVGDSHWGMFGRPAHKFLGIYSGRINASADIGLVWREEVIKAVCSTYKRNLTFHKFT